MITITGTFEKGKITFDQEINTDKPIKVIITFLEDVEYIAKEGFKLSDFSFSKTRSLLKSFKGSFSETVIEERRKDL